ncbi:short chain dehydrogenase [Whalleya microplaca]|nr:short chain dehydrogenase [Whalleya microplaca]
MARIFITGSADGLGLRAAQALIKRGHEVTLHARSVARAADARAACPGAADVLVADLSSIAATKALAAELNARGPWDTIVHNAGLFLEGRTQPGEGELPPLFAVNTLAPYILSSLVSPPPRRLVFVSSQMHKGGDAGFRDLRGANYSDSKLHDLVLAFWFARRFGDGGTLSNSVDPGWVATKMGGVGAPDDIGAAVDTYVMLAEDAGPAHGRTGTHWYQMRERSVKSEVYDQAVQEKLVRALAEISGVEPPQ